MSELCATHRACCCLALVALLAPSSAGAREVWKSEEGSSALEVRAFYKTQASGLRLQRGLVEVSEALAALTATTALPLYGATSVHSARISAEVLLHDRLELKAGWQLAGLVASDRVLTGSAALSGGVPVAAAQGARRRVVDFDPVLAEQGGMVLQHNLDLLAVKVRGSFADLVVGRQILSWGSGRLWNPTDLLSPFGPADIDREVRRGVDAVRISVPLAAAAQLELLWLPQPEARDHGFVARGQFNIAGFDIAPSAAKYMRDIVLGLDATGDAGPLGVHGEVAWTIGLEEEAGIERDQLVRAVAGIDARPFDELVLTAEYYFNGWGASNPSGYFEVLQSERVTRGEVFGAGRHYLGLVASYKPTELLTLQGLAITNLLDPSVLFVPSLEYWAEQSVLVRLGGYLPLGRAPDPSAMRSLSTLDLQSNSEAWQQASKSFGLGSEYGASPFGVFVQVALYL